MARNKHAENSQEKKNPQTTEESQKGEKGTDLILISSAQNELLKNESQKRALLAPQPKKNALGISPE